MENNLPQSRDDTSVNAAEARQTLRALGADQSDLAARVATPAWYHPAMGGLAATETLALGLLPPMFSALIVTVCVTLMLLSLRSYESRCGVSIQSFPGPHSRHQFAVAMTIVMAGLSTALAANLLHLSSWWAVGAAVVVAGAVVVFGHLYDNALRQDLAQGR